MACVMSGMIRRRYSGDEHATGNGLADWFTDPHGSAGAGTGPADHDHDPPGTHNLNH